MSSRESTCESADPANFESALAMSTPHSDVAAYSKLPSSDRPELICFPALFMYDYVLTLTREVDFFWNQPRRTCAFALFVANCYIALFGHIPAFLEKFLSVSGGPDSPVRVSASISYDSLTRVSGASDASARSFFHVCRCQRLHFGDEIVIAILQVIGGGEHRDICTLLTSNASQPS